MRSCFCFSEATCVYVLSTRWRPGNSASTAAHAGVQQVRTKVAQQLAHDIHTSFLFCSLNICALWKILSVVGFSADSGTHGNPAFIVYVVCVIRAVYTLSAMRCDFQSELIVCRPLCSYFVGATSFYHCAEDAPPPYASHLSTPPPPLI